MRRCKASDHSVWISVEYRSASCVGRGNSPESVLDTLLLVILFGVVELSLKIKDTFYLRLMGRVGPVVARSTAD